MGGKKEKEKVEEEEEEEKGKKLGRCSWDGAEGKGRIG